MAASPTRRRWTFRVDAQRAQQARETSAAPATVSILGPNGAGKTTTVRILATLLRPDGGRAEVGGFDVVAQADQVRARIGLTGQYAAIDELLTGRENLELVAGLSHLGRGHARRRAAELLERFDLTEAGSRRAGAYSGGMRRRLDLAASPGRSTFHPISCFLTSRRLGSTLAAG